MSQERRAIPDWKSNTQLRPGNAVLWLYSIDLRDIITDECKLLAILRHFSVFLLTGCIPEDWREPILASSCDGLAFYQQELLDILRTVETVNCRNRWSWSTTPTPEPRPAWALRQSGLEPAQRLGLYGFGASAHLLHR